MKGCLKFIKFYFFTILAVGFLTGGLSFLIYLFNGRGKYSIFELTTFAAITGLANGIFLGGTAILFLSLKYYWSTAKTKFLLKKNDR